MKSFLIVTTLLLGISQTLFAQAKDWSHSGYIHIITSPEGANLPASASEKNVPILVRLDKDFFDFSQAKADGADLRFSSQAKSLAYQIEQWDTKNGKASIWVKIPEIKGNSKQAIKLHWGNPKASSKSNGKDVFNDANDYVSVWHMDETKSDSTGNLIAKDTGTKASAGIIGGARYFSEGKGMNCGGDRSALDYTAGWYLMIPVTPF